MTEEYRGYLIKGDGTFGYHGIYPKGKGSIPKLLKGQFTNVQQARNVIDRSLESLKKGNPNGKAATNG